MATRFYNRLCQSVHLSVRPSVRPSIGPSVGPFVGPSIGLSVGPSVTLYFFGVFVVFGLTAPTQMMKRPQIWPLPTRMRLR